MKFRYSRFDRRAHDLDVAISAIGAATGPGSQSRRAELLGALFSRATADEQEFIRRLFVGELRQGAQEVRDVQNIADILVDPEGAKERRDHWEKTAHALLTGAILHVLYAEEEKTLARVATFLADPSRSILRTLKIMLATYFGGLGGNRCPVRPGVGGRRG